MAVQRYAIVSDETVTDIVLWDAQDQPDWKPVKGEVVACPDNCAIGWTFKNNAFASG